MRKTLSALALAIGALFAAPAQAAVVSITPGISSQSTGGIFTLDVNVSGLGGEIVSVFDLNIYFDPTVLAAVGVALGPGLGGPWTDLSTILGDSFDLFAFSNLVDPTDPGTDDALAVLQADGSFTLATLTLQALAPGVSQVSFGLGANERDIVGRQAEFLTVQYNGACVAVNDVTGGDNVCEVPEPGSAPLLALALAGLALSAGVRRVVPARRTG